MPANWGKGEDRLGPLSERGGRGERETHRKRALPPPRKRREGPFFKRQRGLLPHRGEEGRTYNARMLREME